MSGGGGKSPKDPFRKGKKAIGEGIDDFLDRDFNNFDTISREERLAAGIGQLGTGVIRDTPGLKGAIQSGGFVPFTREERLATRGFEGLRGGDRALGTAEGAANNFRSAFGNVNFRQLEDFNSGATRGVDFSALRRATPRAQERLGFEAVQQRDRNERFLRNVGRGDFLSPDSNPHLRASIEASQRPVLEAFREQIQPQLASQFGGGFGVGSSLAINAQRRAARDLTRNLSDSATQAFNQNFQAERDRQDRANQFLSDQQLQRGTTLGQLRLSRAQGIDNNRLSRAQSLDQLRFNRARGIDQDSLSRAGTLGQLRLSRAQGLDSGRLNRINALTGIGQARGAQSLAANQALLGAGAQRRAVLQQGVDIARRQFDATENKDLTQLQLVSPLVGALGGPGAPPGRNPIAGAAGGALAGAGAGAALGSVVPGLGTGIGAIGGGLIGGISGFL